MDTTTDFQTIRLANGVDAECIGTADRPNGYNGHRITVELAFYDGRIIAAWGDGRAFYTVDPRRFDTAREAWRLLRERPSTLGFSIGTTVYPA